MLHKKLAFDFAYIALGVLSAAVGLKGFLLPNGFFDGGVTGISLLLNHFTKIQLGLFIFFVNIPFIFLGRKLFSIEFAIKSMIAIFSLALAIHWIDLPVITHEKLLISVFGGVLLGVGIGLAMRGGAVIDGTEILAVHICRRSSLSVGDFIALFNFVLFLFVAYLINVDAALYSILTYFSASKSVDFIVSGIEEYVGVTIISPQFKEIHSLLVNDLKRGVTIYKIEGGYGKHGNVSEERRSLFCVVTRLEVTEIIANVRAIDSDAFIIQTSLKDTHGGMIKRRPLHNS